MYQEFAKIYDEFMQDIPEKDWADYIELLWKEHNIKPQLVLDLACGTGRITSELQSRGYDMIGADASADMLDIARERAEEKGQDILYLLQDMREFELYGTVGSVICTCDSLNYLLQEEEIAEVFRLAENYLDPGGLLVFDVNTAYKFETILGDNTFADVAENAAFIWQNYFYQDEKINEYQVTFFCQNDDSYERHEETHYERAYDLGKLQDLLSQNHLKVEGIYDAFTLKPPTETSERVFFVAREQRKKVQ